MSTANQIVNIAGWSTCGFYRRAHAVLSSLSILFPSRFQISSHEFETRSDYRQWIEKFRAQVPDARAHSHSSSPFCWLSSDINQTPNPKDIVSFIGGHDDTLSWCRNLLSPTEPLPPIAEVANMVDDGHSSDHSYDFDLVVIGGGSGGLACSKEAASFGAKVAVLDFVKPSPHGSAWGLGGTCVNVGCIPKKLMHYAALVKESIKYDAEPFGISTSAVTSFSVPHSWESLRENVQNHIHGLNFKYRVNLRENNVVYLNQLAKFLDRHTLEVTDKKGTVSKITSSRFVVAVGGRPTPLDCEGGELAISSDDLFSLNEDPGRVLCVGASYISLECAGFLAGLGHDVTVAVRSILLRYFDRECAEKIGSYMSDHGVTFRKEVVPTRLEKVPSAEGVKERIQVTFSDGTTDIYDTVVAAIGRTADTKQLGLEAVNIAVEQGNAKIPAIYEQTSCPNVYVIGDCMKGCPELTPVAIEAGIALARRLFNGSKVPMDYKNVCTTVFTPIEYGCVGLSEEDAIEAYGENNIDVFHKSFFPLEWTLSYPRQEHQAFTKVIVLKSSQNVLGIHYVGPNAGEVMQGYGVAMKKRITFQDLLDTVGIHPTCSEEIVTLKVTKRSGLDATAGGC